MDEQTQARLEKLLALSQQGVGGEQTNATEMLERLLKEHGLSMADLIGDQTKLVRVEQKYNDPHDRMLFAQIVSKVLDTSNPPIKRWNNTRTLFVDVTPSQKAEIVVLRETYRKALHEERDTLFNAFVIKHQIWSASSKSAPRELTPEEKRARAMAGGLKNVHVNQRIEHETKKD